MSVKGSPQDKRNTQNTVQFRTERKRSATERKGSACLCILLSTGALVSDLQYSSEQTEKVYTKEKAFSVSVYTVEHRCTGIWSTVQRTERKKSTTERESGSACLCILTSTGALASDLQYSSEQNGKDLQQRKGSAFLILLTSKGALVSDLQHSSEQNGKGLQQRGRCSACLCILTSAGALVSDLVVAARDRRVVGIAARETVTQGAQRCLPCAEVLRVHHCHALHVRHLAACTR